MPNVFCISDIDKPLVFLKCLIQLISDIASILPDLHCVIVSTPITVEGLGVAGKSFFIICTDFKTVQDSALLHCKALHFYFAIHIELDRKDKEHKLWMNKYNILIQLIS